MNQLKPQEIARTGDDSPAPNVLAYTWRMNGWRQVGACVVAVGVALLNLAPIELQRRIIDHAIANSDLGLMITLGAVYLAVTLSHKALKFALRVYQNWLAESAVLYSRRHLIKLHARRDGVGQTGRAVSIIGAEVDRLGGFVGPALSQACVNITMLLGAVVYMFGVQPRIAAISLALLIPQVVITPLLQRRINRRTERRLSLLRGLGDAIASGEAQPDAATDARLLRIYRNRLWIVLYKEGMKALLNLLNALAPISVLLWGGYLAIQGETTVGVLVAFVSGFERISGPVRELITFYRNYAQAEVQHSMIAKWM